MALYYFFMIDKLQQHKKIVQDYKAQQYRELMERFPPHARHRLKESSAYNQQTIQMGGLAIQGNHLLFRQLSTICQLIHRQNKWIDGPLGAFLNISKIFSFEDQNSPEITYFIDRNTKESSEISLNKLVNIWKRMRQLENQQFFIFNPMLKNFSSYDEFLINLNNLIVLKLDFEIRRQEGKTKETWIDPEIQKELIKNSKKIIQSQTFYKFVQQIVDPSFGKNYFTLDSFYYLHRKQFMKFVQILIEKRQQLQMTAINTELVTALRQIKTVQMSPYTLNRPFFDMKLEDQLKKCQKIVDTQASSSQIHKYYKYPQFCNFQNYTEEQHKMLVNTCRSLLDKDRIDVDLLEGSFNCIIDPRDFLYLQVDIQELCQQELRQQLSLLSLEDSVDVQMKAELAHILKSSADRLKGIFHSTKFQSCKFFQKNQKFSVRTTNDNSNFLYRNYWNYKDHIDSMTNNKQCQIHRFPLQYSCDCSLNTNNPQTRYCYFCLQQKHMSHKARCGGHNESLRYLLEQENEEGGRIVERSFGCETCKRQASSQILITPICVLHRLPINYVCLELQCEVLQSLCYQCLRDHQGHQQQIVRIPQKKEQDGYPQGDFSYIRSTAQILCKQKFFKYYQIYQGKLKLAQIFLHQLQNRSNKLENNQNYFLPNLYSDDESKQFYLKNMRTIKYLHNYNNRQIKEINEYFTDQIQQLTSKLFQSISIELNQLQKKVNSIMFDESLLQNAQDYLDRKYETITNIRNSRMEEVMIPCRLNQIDIPKHHYHRIKKVQIDEVIDKESINNPDERNGQRGSSKNVYKESIKKYWRQFYKGADYKKYLGWFDKIRKGTSNEVLYENKLIIQRKKQIDKLKKRQKSLQKRRLYDKQYQQLGEFQHDGQFLFSMLNELQEKVEDRAAEICLASQPSVLSEFQFIKKLPNIQHYNLKLHESRNIYQDITAQQISCLFNSSNLNYLQFDYLFQTSSIKSMAQKIAQQSFNKKISFYLSSQDSQCLNQSYKEFIMPKSESQFIQKCAQQINFGNLCVDFYSDKQKQGVPSLRKITKTLDNLGAFGISLVFDQLQGDSTETQLNNDQEFFLNNMLTFIGSRSKLCSLWLKQVQFNQASNRLLSQVFQSNYQLNQLIFVQCRQLDQNCLEYINSELQTEFDLPFRGRCLSTFTNLKKLAMNGTYLSAFFFEKTNRKFKDTLIDLQLTDLILQTVSNSAKVTTQFYSFKQLLSLFKDCSLHYLQVQHNGLNPRDLLVLQSNQLSYLKLSSCQKITNDCLQLINKKWPYLKILDFNLCPLLVKDPIKTWLSFENAVEISINKNQITERQLRIIRKNGINMKICLN